MENFCQIVLDRTETEERGRFVQRWREIYGDIEILLETQQGTWGGIHNRRQEVAIIKRVDSDVVLHRIERSHSAGQLISCSESAPGDKAVRDIAFIWAMEQSTVAQSAFLEMQAEAHAARRSAEDGEVVDARRKGAVCYLASQDIGNMCSVDVAELLGIGVRRLLKWLLANGIATNRRGVWVASDAALQHSTKAHHIVWNLIGVNRIRQKLKEQGACRMTEADLLRVLAKQFPEASAWMVLSKASAPEPRSPLVNSELYDKAAEFMACNPGAQVGDLQRALTIDYSKAVLLRDRLTASRKTI